MKPSPIRTLAAQICAIVMLLGCASQPVTTTPGEVRVFYSTRFPDGTVLKEIPEEVNVVKRETTMRAVGLQVGLNIFMLALGGGLGVHGFSKDQLQGERIETATSRANLRNPVSGTFLRDLQHRIDAAVLQDPELKSRLYTRPLIVAGGSASLVYEALLDDEPERFRLKSDLVIYKRKENEGLFSVAAPPQVDCRAESGEPQPLEAWALDNFLPIKTALDDMLASCQEKVMAALPDLLNE